MRPLLVLAAVALCLCCNKAATPPAPPAAVLGPDLGAFAIHVSQPTIKNMPGTSARLLKVDEPFDNALQELKPILDQAGWSVKPATFAEGVRGTDAGRPR